MKELVYRDATNREGLAAKVYFRALFGEDFVRTRDDPVNCTLNYGYSILLSAFNREIAANGYLTQLGLFHDNMFNSFNLASDLMEPLRPLVDAEVRELQPTAFEKEERHRMAAILSKEVKVDGTRQYLLNAISLYCRGVFQTLNTGDLSYMSFPEL